MLFMCRCRFKLRSSELKNVNLDSTAHKIQNSQKNNIPPSSHAVVIKEIEKIVTVPDTDCGGKPAAFNAPVILGNEHTVMHKWWGAAFMDNFNFKFSWYKWCKCQMYKQIPIPAEAGAGK